MFYAIAIVLLALTEASAQEISLDRKAAMLPHVAQDRDQAMNTAALCAGDIDALKAEVETLKAENKKLQAPPKTDH